jgi:hypothetical protein
LIEAMTASFDEGMVRDPSARARELSTLRAALADPGDVPVQVAQVHLAEVPGMSAG